MDILLLTHYFEPENGAPQRRWSALIEGLTALGHRVHIVAPSPHYPTGRAIDRSLPEHRVGSMTVGSHGGIVHRVSYLWHTGSMVTRTLDHVWVATRTVRAVARLVRAGSVHPDVVVATAPGLPTLAAGRALSKRFDLPLVVEMRDAWPDLVSHTPGLQRGRGVVGAVKRRVHVAVTELQRAATTVVTTTETFAQVLRDRGIRRVRVVRNGTSLERYAIIPPTLHDHSSLRVLYMGTVGRSQGLEYLVRAARSARDRGLDVEVRVVGYGADLKALQALNRALGHPVDFRDRVEPADVFGHYSWADTTLVSLRPWAPFEWTVPSKLYELMATGKHVTAMVSGEAADLVLRSGCGHVVPPGSVEGLVDLWERLTAERGLLDRTAAGREWVASNADMTSLANAYSLLLAEARHEHDKR